MCRTKVALRDLQQLVKRRESTRMMQQLHQQQQPKGQLFNLHRHDWRTELHLGESQQVTEIAPPRVQQRLVQVRLQPQAVLRVHGQVPEVDGNHHQVRWPPHPAV